VGILEIELPGYLVVFFIEGAAGDKYQDAHSWSV
jgi:hypothetical protein